MSNKTGGNAECRLTQQSRFEHIPKDKRKKILLLSDDI